MKKISYLVSLVLVILLSPLITSAQNNYTSVDKFPNDVPSLAFQQPNLSSVYQEDIQRDKNGQFYRIGVGTDVQLTPQNSGVWTIDENGNKIWRLKVKYPRAEALSFIFSKFHVFGNTTLDVYNPNGKRIHETYTSKDVLEHGQQHLDLCQGDYMMLELVEPNGTQPSIIEIEQIAYIYRGSGFKHAVNENKDFNDSESCEINVNCSPEGNAWQDEKKGVARILLKIGGSYGWCSGSLINNASQDCTPYFLTAMHCGAGASTSDLNVWKFYFNYEAVSCSNPSSQGTLANSNITGCLKIAASEDVSGTTISKSDFYLVKLGNASNQTTTINSLKSFGAYWNGWNANNTAPTGGVGIHHPAGDIKKISTYTATATSTTYSGVTANTHWQVNWAATSNGQGVTEGGSSGSPLFKYNGGNSQIVGTLSGGTSYCSSPNAPDVYGKVSYDWTSCGSTSNKQLKPWLDPANTGALTLDGSSDPCSASPGAPNANFVANQTNVTTGTTVNFTDLTSGSPTSWAWSVTPSSGWSYTGGTNATSQNPKITFNNVGSYTISLTATNANGSDTETKVSYIIVTTSGNGTPCVATSTSCDEYIAQVKLGTINNTTGCTNYTDYSTMTTPLVKGQQYTITVVGQITGQQFGSLYENDVIAVWIDYNNNGVFTDAGERIALETVTQAGYAGQYNFTVPSTATIGVSRMRLRVNYLPSGTIDPCGTTQYGEVEDYRVVISAGSVGIEQINSDAVVVYPNPTADRLTVDLNSYSENVMIAVIDVSGKEVLTSIEKNVVSFQLDLSNLSPGIYQMTINTDNGKIYKKIIKN